MGWVRRWVEEDAFLNFRVVEQIRAGHGPVFNVGERVEIFTSTLWLAMLTAARTVLPFVKIEYLSIAGGLLLTGLGLWWAERGAAVLWRSDVEEPGSTTDAARALRRGRRRGGVGVVGLGDLRARERAQPGVARRAHARGGDRHASACAPVVDPRCAGGGRARGPGPAGAARSRGGERGRGGRGAVVAAPSGCRARLARGRLPRAPGRLRGLPRRVLRRAGPEHRARQGLRRHVLVAGLELSRRPRRALLALGSPARDRRDRSADRAGERTASRVGEDARTPDRRRAPRAVHRRERRRLSARAIAVAEPVRDRRAVRGASLAAAVPVAARGHRRLGVRRDRVPAPQPPSADRAAHRLRRRRRARVDERPHEARPPSDARDRLHLRRRPPRQAIRGTRCPRAGDAGEGAPRRHARPYHVGDVGERDQRLPRRPRSAGAGGQQPR